LSAPEKKLVKISNSHDFRKDEVLKSNQGGETERVLIPVQVPKSDEKLKKSPQRVSHQGTPISKNRNALDVLKKINDHVVETEIAKTQK
jgi:hypothetical protein